MINRLFPYFMHRLYEISLEDKLQRLMHADPEDSTRKHEVEFMGYCGDVRARGYGTLASQYVERYFEWRERRSEGAST